MSPGDPDPGPFDGLLLAGGADIDPARYGDSAETPTLDLDPERDALDFSLVTAAETQAVPVFGICRGFQALNVALGGTLFQDLPSQRARGIAHDVENESRGSGDRAHIIRGRPGSGSRFAGAVAALAGRPVNSRHHQGISRPASRLWPPRPTTSSRRSREREALSWRRSNGTPRTSFPSRDRRLSSKPFSRPAACTHARKAPREVRSSRSPLKARSPS